MSKCWCGRDLNTAGICPAHPGGVMELPFEEPDMGKGLVAELRAENKRLKEQALADDLAMEAAAERDNAEIKRLREALEAIIAVPANWGSESYDMIEIARKALEEGGSE